MNKNVLVLGAGVAGLQAALSLKELGYRVTILEKSSSAGGHLKDWDKLYPGNISSSGLIDNLISALDGTDILYNTTVTRSEKSDNGFIT
ncbi:MAG: FAD-dependent oxidoreductase, partial [Bacteroidales bacterium]|nr:FAD-dependent oxidoreductase [Bacteroidales bacterium]